MGLKRFKPVTPGTRGRIGNNYDGLTKGAEVEKSLTTGATFHRSGGRNNQGRMSMRYIGGGHKKLYRLIDFKRDKAGIGAVVDSIQYDPNRTAFIALLKYQDGEKRYILAPSGLKAGDKIMSGPEAAIEVGNALPLQNIPQGTVVHNIELKPGKGGALARSAGTYAQLSSLQEKYAVLKMPSGETRLVLKTCMATIGSVSNADHSLEQYGKAGRKRWVGRRPRTRGVAMNPVDHPMGGGEGRASGGQPRSRKGLYSKGKKTRNTKKYSNKYIIERRKK